MKPILYNYRCESCDFTFKVPEITEAYGEFIMHSDKTNESVYLSGFDDKVFTEVIKLYENNEIVKNTGRVYDAELFQSIFSVSCDLADDGGQYQIRIMPLCPNCGSRKMASWGPTNPAEYSKEDIKPVTHEKWSKLTDIEKQDLIDKAIENHLNKN
jgi:hypothetical protein